MCLNCSIYKHWSDQTKDCFFYSFKFHRYFAGEKFLNGSKLISNGVQRIIHESGVTHFSKHMCSIMHPVKFVQFALLFSNLRLPLHTRESRKKAKKQGQYPPKSDISWSGNFSITPLSSGHCGISLFHMIQDYLSYRTSIIINQLETRGCHEAGFRQRRSEQLRQRIANNWKIKVNTRVYLHFRWLRVESPFLLTILIWSSRIQVMPPNWSWAFLHCRFKRLTWK